MAIFLKESELHVKDDGELDSATVEQKAWRLADGRSASQLL